MAANDPAVYGASWYAANMVETPGRGPLNIELDVDVCVVGAGLAGLTVALEVARRGWSVAVLEARRVAWNASGRNMGIVQPGYPTDVLGLIEKLGSDHAKQLWQLSEAGVEYVRRTARDVGMPGIELVEEGALRVSKTGHDGRLKDYAGLLTREFGAAAEFWPAERVRTQLRSTRYFGGIHYSNAFALNPLNYALGLAAAATAAGAQIYEMTPALEIDPAGVRKRITTPSARVRAGHVVLAGNVHIGHLLPQLADTLVPSCNYMITTAPLGERLADAIRFHGPVSDSDLGNSQYRVVGGDRLMWAGRFTVGPEGDARRYVKTLIADIGRIYPQLGTVEAEYAWTGTLGTTVHRMPQIGELSPGVWLLSGFGSQGINTTAMGGELVSRAIVDGAQTWQLFQPFDLVWAGGTLGRAAVRAHYRYLRAREGVEGIIARRGRSIELPAAEPVPTAPQEIEAATAPAPEEPAKPSKRKRRKAKSAAEPSADGAAPAG